MTSHSDDKAKVKKKIFVPVYVPSLAEVIAGDKDRAQLLTDPHWNNEKRKIIR